MDNDFNPDWVSCPGETIYQILKHRNQSIVFFAEKIGRDSQFVNSLLNGEVNINTELAEKLSNTLGSSSKFWLSREVRYRERVETWNNAWLSGLPISEMRKYGWINSNSDPLNECLNFFNVKDAFEWNRVYFDKLSSFSFRTSKTYSQKFGSTVTWLRKAELIADQVECAELNLERLEHELPTLKKISRKKKPSSFIPDLHETCRNLGIALTILQTPNGCRASGASKLISKDKALIVMSLRYLSDDHFWFTFFHELGHILLHGGDRVFVDEEIYNQEVDEEVEANLFAGEVLIPSQFRKDLKVLRGKRAIIEFANEMSISPGIVVGQMQHYGLVAYSNLNGYKRRYDKDEVLAILNN